MDLVTIITDGTMALELIIAAVCATALLSPAIYDHLTAWLRQS